MHIEQYKNIDSTRTDNKHTYSVRRTFVETTGQKNN